MVLELIQASRIAHKQQLVVDLPPVAEEQDSHDSHVVTDSVPLVQDETDIKERNFHMMNRPKFMSPLRPTSRA